LSISNSSSSSSRGGSRLGAARVLEGTNP
jgi:hypothetical protein